MARRSLKMLLYTTEPGLARTDTCGNLLEQEYITSGLIQISSSQSQHLTGILDTPLVLLLDDLGQGILSLYLNFIIFKMLWPPSMILWDHAYENALGIFRSCIYENVWSSCYLLPIIFLLIISFTYGWPGISTLETPPSCDFRAIGQWKLAPFYRRKADLFSWDSYNFLIWPRHFDIIEKVEYEAFTTLSILSLSGSIC